MKRLAAFALCLLLLLCCGCQSIEESSEESVFRPQINPYSRDTGDEMQSVTLYFPVTGESYLSSYTTTVDVHSEAGDTLTEALMRALIKGPEQGVSLDPVFSENLKRVSMHQSNDTLTIVLSKEMLALGENTSDSALKKQLTLYSIVNTMTGEGEISRVQILIDMDGTGHAEAPTRQQMGLPDTDEGRALGPLGFSNAWLLTPAAAAQTVLDAGMEKDAPRMIRMLSSSVLALDEQALENKLQTASVLIVDYYVTNTMLSADNSQATVYVDITYELLDRTIEQVFNQAITLKRERGTWKVDYLSVESLLFP